MTQNRRGSGYCQDPLAGAPVAPDQQSFIVVDTIEDLRAYKFSQSSFKDGQLVYVKGYYSAEDGGGGFFNYSRHSDDDENNGTIIEPDNGFGRYLRLYEGTKINVLWFGAKGNGTSDDTVAIQAAIDFCEAQYTATVLGQAVYLPARKYFVSATLTVETNGVAVVGDGMMDSIITRSGDYGDTLHVTGSYLGGNNVMNLGFVATGQVTTGAHLVTQQLAYSTIQNVALKDGFGGLKIVGCYMLTYDNITILGGSNLAGTGTVTGSYYLSIPTNGGPAYPSFDVLISNFNFRNTGDNKRIEHGIEIFQCDGVWFSNGHVIGAKIECYIAPPITYSANNLLFENAFFDGGCNVALQVVGAGTVAGCRFNNGVFAGADGVGGSDCVAVNCALARGITFNSCEFGSNVAAALNLVAGSYIDVKNCRFLDNDTGSTSNVTTAGPGCSYVYFEGNTFGYTPTNAAIYVNGATNLSISGNRFSQVGGADITLNTVGSGTKIQADNNSDKTIVITSTAALPIPQVGTLFAVTGTTTITSIAASISGRTIQLLFDANVTVTNGANLLLSGGVNFSATDRDVLTLVYSGTGWIETGRSVN